MSPDIRGGTKNLKNKKINVVQSNYYLGKLLLEDNTVPACRHMVPLYSNVLPKYYIRCHVFFLTNFDIICQIQPGAMYTPTDFYICSN